MDLAKKSATKASLKNAAEILRATNKESHMIMKPCKAVAAKQHMIVKSRQEGSAKPPVIKVVHIFNPTVFKTDAANFRSLVQKLTGRSCMPLKRSGSHSCGASKVSWPKSGEVPLHSSFYDGQLKQIQARTKGQDFGLKELSFSDDVRHSAFSFNFCGMSAPYGGMKSHNAESFASFSDLDIISGLVSGEPLPDFNLLPPLSDLSDHFFQETRICGIYD